MSAHTGKSVVCSSILTDDDGEELTTEQELHGNHPNAPGTFEVPQRCGTELRFEEHGRFERALKGDRRKRFEAAALVFTCPGCGDETAMCPICSDPDDRSPGGWIDGEESSDQIPCHNCNQEEIAERRRLGRT